MGRAEILGGGSLQSGSVIFYDEEAKFVSCRKEELPTWWKYRTVFRQCFTPALTVLGLSESIAIDR